MISRVGLPWLLAVVPVLLPGLASATLFNDTCYFPDGSESPNDRPCTAAGTTHCCNLQSVCLESGYCISVEQQPYVLSRASCTDSNWGTGCPTLCIGSKDNRSGGSAITWLGKNADKEDLYCCGKLVASDGNVTCGDDADPFTLSTSSLLYGSGILENTTTVAEPVSCAVDSPSSSSSSRTTAVGAGVGVPLGVIAVSALAWAFWERRRRKQQIAELTARSSGDNYGYNGAMLAGAEPKYETPVELSSRPIGELPAH